MHKIAYIHTHIVSDIYTHILICTHAHKYTIHRHIYVPIYT